MTLLKELTLKLQMQAMDIIYAYSAVTSVVSTFKALRLQSELEFKKILTAATKMGVTRGGSRGGGLWGCNPPKTSRIKNLFLIFKCT